MLVGREQSLGGTRLDGVSRGVQDEPRGAVALTLPRVRVRTESSSSREKFDFGFFLMNLSKSRAVGEPCRSRFVLVCAAPRVSVETRAG